MSAEQLCSVCFKSCDLRCGNCNQAAYCTKDHQKEHWPKHKKQCFPFKVQTLPGKGRGLIATKAFDPGQIIYKEKALLNLPSAGDVADGMIGDVCVSCCKVLDEEVRHCSKCGWPVCGQICENDPVHSDNECGLFAERNVSPYQRGSCRLLRILRCLLLKHKQPDKYRKLLELEAHTKEWLGNESGAMTCVATVEMMRKSGFHEWTEIEIIRMLGMLNTNVLSQGADGRQKDLRESAHLYEKACLMSHSCFANLTYKIERDGALRVLVTRPIAIGDELTITYLRLVGGIQERQESSANYFFTCRCPRCTSPTDLGSYFSSLKCHKCPSGFICPFVGDGADPEITWKCEICPNIKSNDYVTNLVDVLEDEVLMQVGATEYNLKVLQQFDALIAKCEKVFHPNHFLIYDLLYDLIEWLHNLVTFYSERLSKKEVGYVRKRIITTGERLLALLDMISPGPRLNRGRILSFMATGVADEEVINTMAIRTISNSLGGICSSTSTTKKPSDSVQKFTEVVKKALEILAFEPKGTENEMVYRNLKDQLQLLESVKL